MFFRPGNAYIRMLMKRMFCLLLLFTGMLAAQEEGRGDLRLVFYNTENYFDPFDDSLSLDEEFTPAGSRHWTWERFLEKERRIYKVLASIGEWDPPGLIALCEVENRFVLNRLTGKTPLLKYNYRIIHRDSPDPRGIDVALLYRPAKFRPLHWKYHTVVGTREPTRDILHVNGIALGSDTLHLLVCHWPSRWEGYLESLPERIAAAGTLRRILDSILQSEPVPKILIAGDLNDETGDQSVSSILRVRMPAGRIRDTCIYHTGICQTRNDRRSMPEIPPGSLKYRGNWFEFDHVFVSGSFLSDTSLYVRPDGKRIYAPGFLLEEDPALPGKRPFRTYQGYRYNGGYSDHLPVYIDIWKGKD
jgi:hypothetical protein